MFLLLPLCCCVPGVLLKIYVRVRVRVRMRVRVCACVCVCVCVCVCACRFIYKFYNTHTNERRLNF